jgi:predicted transposase YbfD/YdcC
MPKSLNEWFTKWARTLLPDLLDGLTISFDGKTICSTGKMSEFERPLHILSAHLAELGLTISKKTVDEKSNEIPAMQELLQLIDIRGCMVVADALNCQTETAEVIINNGGDYLLNAKGNQKTLMNDIEDFVQDEELRAGMESKTTREMNGGRIEVRCAYVTTDIDWMTPHLEDWMGLSCIGAINRRFTINGATSNEWHYYICSRELSPEDLLKYARNEWSIESMHWLLDVHFDEDSCRLREQNSNENMNIIRKIALNCIRNFKNKCDSKLPISKLMLSCLCDCTILAKIVSWK